MRRLLKYQLLAESTSSESRSSLSSLGLISTGSFLSFFLFEEMEGTANVVLSSSLGCCQVLPTFQFLTLLKFSFSFFLRLRRSRLTNQGLLFRLPFSELSIETSRKTQHQRQQTPETSKQCKHAIGNVLMTRCWKPLSCAKIPGSSSGVDSSTPLECHVIRYAKKEICNNSATEKDFEFVFFFFFSEKDSLSHKVYDPKMSQF